MDCVHPRSSEVSERGDATVGRTCVIDTVERNASYGLVFFPEIFILFLIRMLLLAARSEAESHHRYHHCAMLDLRCDVLSGHFLALGDIR